jgi:hypothetical protein
MKLFKTLHLKNSEVMMLKYELQHKDLQIQSLMTLHRESKLETERLQHEMARAEQDILLLQVNM